MATERTFRDTTLAIIQRATKSEMVRKTLIPFLRCLDMVGGLAIKTWIGAKLIGLVIPRSRPVLCSACFSDHGLQIDAERIGIPHALPCPNCGTKGKKKLTPYLVRVLASQFFVRGSVHREAYGSAPLVQFNEAQFQKGDYSGPEWLNKDVALISESGRIGLFHYGPRLWMIGYVEPLEALQDSSIRQDIVDRILKEYPERILPKGEIVYRLRANPEDPGADSEFNSPPDELLGRGRLDSVGQPILYCSQDIEGCVHECRVTVEDELYLAALEPARDLKLLDLTALLREEGVTEFESLDIAVHMLFFAADHSYEITRSIAVAAKKEGFDGLLYPSYFSQVRSGAIPFETVYGLSVRRFPGAAKYGTSGIFLNVALFGRPVKENILIVTCINRLVIHKVQYEFCFGPVHEKYALEDEDIQEGPL